MAVSLVQAIAKSATGASLTASATLTSAPTAGNLLLFICAFKGGVASITTIPTGSSLVSTAPANGNADCAVYQKTAAGGDSATWSFTASSDIVTLHVIEVTATSSTPVVNNTLAWTNANSTTSASGAVTPTITGGMGFAICSLDPNETTTSTVSGSWVLQGSSFGNFRTLYTANQAGLGTSSVTGCTFSYPVVGPSVNTTMIVVPGPSVTMAVDGPPRNRARFRANLW